MAEEQRQWYTVKDAARILEFSEMWIRKMLRDGKLKGRKFGREWRIPRSEVMPPNEPSE